MSGTEQEMAVLRGGKGKSLVSCGQGAGVQRMGSWDQGIFPQDNLKPGCGVRELSF